ncbi:Rap1a/Tai family immunity protein [Piscirickettsia litoralis]|uniref:Rap1a immunity protein domain-containing protein n=1 Tax=Piscirickettsia litoralis TaxID=1891921 RepID=A0ABX3A3V9_9GAMM|nr:Rap1a/Tai family immunity protein [Piscirickettsia litoralis]ODN43556.1 hypothetical protein BGC07_12315 [Piscirickettsia litoralis]
MFGLGFNAHASLYSANQLAKECAIAVKIEKRELPKNNKTMLPALNCIRFIEGVRQTRLAFAAKADKESLSYAKIHYGKINNGERAFTVYNYLKAHINSTNENKPASLAVLAALNKNYPLEPAANNQKHKNNS